MFIAIGLKAQAFNLFIHLPSAASALTTRNKPTKQWFFCCIKNENTKILTLTFSSSKSQLYFSSIQQSKFG